MLEINHYDGICSIYHASRSLSLLLVPIQVHFFKIVIWYYLKENTERDSNTMTYDPKEVEKWQKITGSKNPRIKNR